MEQDQHGKLLTVSEVSVYLNIKQKTIYAKVEAGEIPCYRIGSLIRFRLNEIDRWLETCRNGHKPEIDPSEKKKKTGKTLKLSNNHIDKIAQNIIDEETCKYYHTKHGKSDLVEAHDKENNNGSI